MHTDDLMGIFLRFYIIPKIIMNLEKEKILITFFALCNVQNDNKTFDKQIVLTFVREF